MSLHPIVKAHEEGFNENMYLDPQTRTKVETITKTIKGGEKIKIDMLASGGTAIEFDSLS